MQQPQRARRAHHASLAWLLPLLMLTLAPTGAAADEPPPTVVDSQSIVRSLAAPAVSTRGFEVAPKVGAATEASGGGQRITLDIRFASDSDQLTPGAQAQLAQLGTALTSPELAHSRFLIAGHTSATGSAEHNQHLSEARARSVRSYLIERFHLAPGRLEATGYGSSRPLPNFPPGALQQRRVEISTLPSTS